MAFKPRPSDERESDEPIEGEQVYVSKIFLLNYYS